MSSRLVAAFAAVMTLSAGIADQVWDFTRGTPNDGRLRSQAETDGKGLKCKPGFDPAQPGGFAVKGRFAYPEAFRFEAEVVMKPTVGMDSAVGVLWDDMYISYEHPKRPNAGMQVTFSRNRDTVSPVVYLGIGGTTYTVRGSRVKIRKGELARFVLEFDANRGVMIEWDGERVQTSVAKAGAIAPAVYPPVIGDRYSSNFWKFEGSVRRVAITEMQREQITIFADGRFAFERGEQNAGIDLAVESPVGDVSDVVLSVKQLDADGREFSSLSSALGRITSGSAAKFTVPVETRLKPGATVFEVEVSAKDAKGAKVTSSRSYHGAVGPTFAERMTTLMWMHSDSYSTVADFGFTHGIGGEGFTGPRKPDADVASVRRLFDKALAEGLRLTRYIKVQYPAGKTESNYYRLGRDGKPSNDWHKKPVPEVSHPDMIAWASKGPSADAELLKDHPGFGGALAVSENRDHTYPSYNTEASRYRAATGFDPPPEATGKVAPKQYAIGHFPDGIVPEDDPVYRYYRWFWNGGDGWPAYLSAIADGYRRHYGSFEDGSDLQRKRPFFTYHDPAVRCPPVWGSGGSVDCLNQWCYANPEPMNVAGPVEEMFAMAEGHPGQQVMIMTQLICYRSQLAPKYVKVDPEPEWVKRRPGADFPSIPPDTLQEATWSMIAKPVRGIMYHGWGCIYETGATNGYTYTNTETTERIRHLLKDVVAPLGPSLLKIGREKSPVAVLESGTTAMLGGPASWGWSAPAITFLQRARLDPRVIYEEAVLKGALDDGSVKVLYAPQLQFTTARVAEKIRAFQAKGGILVGDEQMLKVLKPDVVAPLVSFSAPPASDHTDDVEAMENSKGTDVKTRLATVNAKRTMQRQAESLRGELEKRGFVPGSDSSSSELVVYNRNWRGTPYLFVVNDNRKFGDYVGQWGRTMEKGLPFAGNVTLAGSANRTGAVYELSRGEKLAFEKNGDSVSVPLSFDTNDGRMLVFLPEEIAAVKAEAPVEVAAGGVIEVALSVLGKSGGPVPAVMPVEIRLYDARGTEIDGAGFVAAEGGVCRLRIRTNLNDPEGDYRLICRDRASGLQAVRRIHRGKLSWWKRIWRKLRG